MADVTDATFESEVIERSKTVPVVVDLWAEWCGPCRTLGPTIEKVIAETEGRVELAKVDVDSNPQVAGAFRVQSIPAVYALRDGQVVDHFIGALPEAAVREFVERLAPNDSEADLLVKAGGEDSLRQALEVEPGHELAVTGLAELLVARGDSDEALQLLARIPESADTRRIAAMARMGGSAVSDSESRLAELLDKVKDDEAAKQEYLDILEMMGPDHPRTMQHRRALTMRLF